MAQGKEYTPEQKASILESLRPHLELGFSRSKACRLIGFDESTLSKWAKADEALSMKLEGWENHITAIAIANIQMAIKEEANQPEDTRKENSWKWAERKEQTLKPKSDITSNDKELPTPIITLNRVQGDNSPIEDSGSTE